MSIFALAILSISLWLPAIAGGIAPDKAKHFVAGAVISLVTGETAGALKLPHPRLWAFGAAVLAGVAKEVYDRRRGGRFDPNDLAATALGGAVVTFTVRF